MDLADVQELVGHTSAKTTERYAMVSPVKLMGAVGALEKAWAQARESADDSRLDPEARGTDRVARPLKAIK